MRIRQLSKTKSSKVRTNEKGNVKGGFPLMAFVKISGDSERNAE